MRSFRDRGGEAMREAWCFDIPKPAWGETTEAVRKYWREQFDLFEAYAARLGLRIEDAEADKPESPAAIKLRER